MLEIRKITHYSNYMGFSQFENIITSSERQASLWKDRNGTQKGESIQTGQTKMLIFPTTLPETNIAPTNGWLEYNFPIGVAYFRGLC